MELVSYKYGGQNLVQASGIQVNCTVNPGKFNLSVTALTGNIIL
jgi:hypothetical protein